MAAPIATRTASSGSKASPRNEPATSPSTMRPTWRGTATVSTATPTSIAADNR